MGLKGIADTPARVLIIDTPESLEQIAPVLVESGFEILTYGSANDIRACLRRKECDVILADVEFAETLGMDILAETAGPEGHIPTVVASAKPTLGKVLNAWNRAASFFLKKPLEPERTTNLLKDAVDNKRFYEQVVGQIEELEKENGRLNRERENSAQATEQFDTFERIAKSIASSLDLDEVLKEILVSISNATHFDRVVLSLIDWDQKLEEAVMATGIPEDRYESQLAEKVWPLTDEKIAPWAEQVFHRKLKYFAKGEFGNGETAQKAARLYPGPMAKIPLVVKDVVVGTITVDNHESHRPITEDNTALLERFSEYAGIAIMNAKLYMRAVEAQEELKAAHAKLIEAERLKTIERMVATVNHEINNPLCSILLSAQMLEKMFFEGDESVKRKAKSIVENADRIASIVSKLENIQRVASQPADAGNDMFDLDELMNRSGS
ncbi:MAG: response regulator [Candidatus Coatesbacteria bacterium]|nr:response regulator [Candidatus Coatesbacteria bacterium]